MYLILIDLTSIRRDVLLAWNRAGPGAQKMCKSFKTVQDRTKVTITD